MKRTLSFIIVIIMFSFCLFAQTKQDEYLVDAFGFGHLSLDDLMARLDAVAPSIYSPSRNKLIVRISGNNEDILDRPFLLGGTISSYLIKNRGLDASRFRIEYCNIQGGKLKTKFFCYS